MLENMVYRPLTADELHALWDEHVRRHPGSEDWARWRRQFIRENAEGLSCTFGALRDGYIISEATVLLTPTCQGIRGRTLLADGQSVANLNALRTRAAYRGQGWMTRLIRHMEHEMRDRGITTLTIGVDETAEHNASLYRSWGYTEEILRTTDDDPAGKDVVIYLAKHLGEADDPSSTRNKETERMSGCPY